MSTFSFLVHSQENKDLWVPENQDYEYFEEIYDNEIIPEDSIPDFLYFSTDIYKNIYFGDERIKKLDSVQSIVVIQNDYMAIQLFKNAKPWHQIAPYVQYAGIGLLLSQAAFFVSGLEIQDPVVLSGLGGLALSGIIQKIGNHKLQKSFNRYNELKSSQTGYAR